MRSSTTPPVASSQHSVYCACPGAIRARSLVSVALTKSRAPRPRTTPLPRWLTSKIPTACRTAACSLSTPPSGYSIGISQPPKSAILAPRPTWRSYSGEWYSGGPAAAAAAEAIMRTDASASPATSAGDKRHCIDVAPGRLAGPCPCWSLPLLVLALAGPCLGRFTRVVRHGLRPKSTLPSTSASPLSGRYLRNGPGKDQQGQGPARRPGATSMQCRLSPAEVAGDALASVRMIASAAAAGTPLYHSPLYDRHVGLGAKMADFGGWEMPIEYPDGGVLKEHAAVRQAVGIFD